MHPVNGNFIHPQQSQPQSAVTATTTETEQAAAKTGTAVGSTGAGDQLDLSPEALRFMEAGQKSHGPKHGGTFTPPGQEKASHSTAAQARAIIEADPSLAEQPFGQIVSQVARGVLTLADVTPEEPDEGTGEVPAGGEISEGEIPVADDTNTVVATTETDGGSDTTSPDLTGTVGTTEPTIADIIEESIEPTEPTEQPAITVAGDGGTLEGELIEALTEEGIDQTV